jgi:transcriptional regulator with XRE-family HTH domain
MAPQRSEAVGPQRSFVIEMRARRETAGLSRYRLAEALGCTPQWLSKVENHEKPPSEGLADDLDTYWKTEGTFRRLWEQMVEAKRQGLISSGFRPLVEAEREAKRIAIYEPLLITGLTQTEEFARHVFSSGARPEKTEELVAIRMGRQSILQKPDSPWLFILLHEGVVRRVPLRFREEQCKRLLDLMADLKVSIQIIPDSAPVYQPGGFQLLSFEGAADVAYIDGAGGHGQMITDPSEVQNLAVLFDVIRSAALSAEESERLIRSILEGE